MKTTCIYYRDWPGQPHWCITFWRECVAMGDECADFTQEITQKELNKETK